MVIVEMLDGVLSLAICQLIPNYLTDVVGLWLNCLSVVDLSCFAIIGRYCCSIYVQNLAVVLFVALILYWIHNFTKFTFKTVSDDVVILIG